MRKAILIYTAAMGLALGAFQNCSKANFSSDAASTGAGTGANAAGTKDGGNGTGGDTNPGPGTSTGVIPPVVPPTPSLVVVADPATVNKGSSTTVSAIMTNVDSVSYSCTASNTTNVVSSGTLSPAATSFNLPVSRDLSCVFVGTGANVATPLRQVLPVAVNCGAQVKNAAGSCQDFACKSVVQISSGALNIPARTIDGVCYAARVISGVTDGTSTLTTAHDPTLLARSHDVATSGTTQNPYLMGSLQVQFNMRGARVVKLAGGADANAPILVDNFILTGIYPVGTTPDVTKAYRVRGTADASILNDKVDTGVVLFNSNPLPVEAFASGGISSIAPIDISAFATPNVTQQLDVRALDCGGSRSLSDIYVLFQ